MIGRRLGVMIDLDPTKTRSVKKETMDWNTRMKKFITDLASFILRKKIE